MKRFDAIESKFVWLPVSDIDTDQIISARYLKTIGKTGLGEGLFADWRADPSFVLNTQSLRTAVVLVAGDNFGCGSSREHAPWALLDWGFRVIIAPSFADIFYGNALKNGLLPIAASPKSIARLTETPDQLVSVLLSEQRVRGESGADFGFSIDRFSKRCLMDGVDSLGYLLSKNAEISAFEGRR